jgi:hypothetical protein
MEWGIGIHAESCVWVKIELPSTAHKKTQTGSGIIEASLGTKNTRKDRQALLIR